MQALEVPQPETRGFLDTKNFYLLFIFIIPPPCSVADGIFSPLPSLGGGMEPRLPGQCWEPTHHQFAVLSLQLAQGLCVAGTEIR